MEGRQLAHACHKIAAAQMGMHYFSLSLTMASVLKRKRSVVTFEKKLEIIAHMKKRKSVRAVSELYSKEYDRGYLQGQIKD